MYEGTRMIKFEPSIEFAFDIIEIVPGQQFQFAIHDKFILPDENSKKRRAISSRDLKIFLLFFFFVNYNKNHTFLIYLLPLYCT